MKRAVILVLDSFGIGAADDAEQFGDAGVDTLGHITAHAPPPPERARVR
jgi:phosphopentomutase